MSCSSTNREGGRLAIRAMAAPRGLTLVELLVALLFVAAVMGGAIVAFVGLQRHSRETKARLSAMAEARFALQSLSHDLAQAQLGPPSAFPQNLFIGANSVLAEGNRKDDDGDDRIDEEVYDGIDDDVDWSSTDDRHAQITPALFERPQGRGFPDLGDRHVDEDTKFGHADLRFRIPGQTTGTVVEVHYYVGDFDGKSNVLIREEVTSAGVEAGPIAFDVLSFTALFWDANPPPGPLRKWVTAWDSTQINPATEVPLPVSVALEVTVYAGTRPYQSLKPTEPIETVRLTTVINVEAALWHPNYQRNTLP
ncbi:MAG: PulJ/GspJ family protein [Candidatus Sumerlaeaceae bacterium]